MDSISAYDDDIYAWAHEQASVLRRLGRTRADLPNELDWNNIAEEIESVGRSELSQAESFLRLLLLHLLKIASAPQARAANHWVAEAKVFQASLARSVTRSIMIKADGDEAWWLACEQARAQLELEEDDILPGLPARLPIGIEDLAARPFSIDGVLERLRSSASSPSPSP